MTAPTVTDVTRDPYVLLTACLTFHKLPPELRKAIKECVDARPPVQPTEPDAARYRWLCKEVADGSWSIGQHTVIDSFGITKDNFMDDKADADATIDAFMQTESPVQPTEPTK